MWLLKSLEPPVTFVSVIVSEKKRDLQISDSRKRGVTSVVSTKYQRKLARAGAGVVRDPGSFCVSAVSSQNLASLPLVCNGCWLSSILKRLPSKLTSVAAVAYLLYVVAKEAGNYVLFWSSVNQLEIRIMFQSRKTILYVGWAANLAVSAVASQSVSTWRWGKEGGSRDKRKNRDNVCICRRAWRVAGSRQTVKRS